MDYTPKKTDKENSILICEGAHVVGSVSLAKGVSVWYNAVIRGDGGDITIGENTNVQDNAVIHAETVVGSHCTIGHSAIVHGCVLGDNVLVGMGSIVLGGAKVADNCIIAAGSVVTGKMDAPAGSMILGSPAKVVRPLTEDEIAGNRASMEEYIEAAALYRKG